MSKRPNLLASFSEKLTFGVELEFGIRFSKRPFTLQEKIWELVRDTLIVETGFDILSQGDVKKLDADLWLPSSTQKIPQAALFNTWVVGADATLHFTDERKADKAYYCPIEIRSPVLKFGTEAFKEVHKMLTAIHKHFDVVVNRSCGFHVHVGKGKAGLNFTPLQHLMATLWVFEPQISELIHKSRAMTGSYCPSLHVRSNLGVLKYEGKLLDVLLGTTDVNEVVEMFSGYMLFNYMSYRIEGLRIPHLNPVKRTIEFRQHEGTMDSETVLNWDLKIFLSKYTNSPECYSVEDLFDEIGFPKSAVEFYRGKVQRLRRIEQKEDGKKAKNK
ncbi:f464f836-336f-4335-9a15-cbbd2b2b8caf [Sclerotinia trifoliorum]|uniref:F464f836-336f-4335-9a15-cbbd2b2b8caf n=1 Tax=Sclerotinia trifoliorum TaxID=28548 RepID=A0A8H2W2W6_9HELO|nr:f464f836-336f-4335-9a15-cbbd2b2b8caf [Sclerotinia trifoliorum]